MPKIETIEIRTNKTNLNKIIKWSTSRWNEQKKADVVNDILERIKFFKSLFYATPYNYTYHTGAYTENSTMSGFTYTLKLDNDKILLLQNFSYDNKIYKKYKLI